MFKLFLPAFVGAYREGGSIPCDRYKVHRKKKDIEREVLKVFVIVGENQIRYSKKRGSLSDCSLGEAGGDGMQLFPPPPPPHPFLEQAFDIYSYVFFLGYLLDGVFILNLFYYCLAWNLRSSRQMCGSCSRRSRRGSGTSTWSTPARALTQRYPFLKGAWHEICTVRFYLYF